MSTEATNAQGEIRVGHLREALRVGLAVVTELWSYDTNDWVSSVHAADIDGDGDIEVLISSRDNKVHVLTNRGGPKWQFEQSTEWVGTVFGIDNFAAPDDVRVVAGSRDNTVYALDKTGKLLWKYATGMVIRQILVQDIDADGKAEVIAGSEDHYIYILDDQGRVLWKHNLWHRVFSVFVIDFDHDGILEILAATEDDSVHALRIELTGNLYSKIISFHEILKRSTAKELKFSSTEETLLRDITGMYGLYGHDVLLEQAEQVQKSGQYLEALSMLLLLEQRKVQHLWAKQVGHVRTVCFGDLDNSAQQEIVLGTHEGRVYVLNVMGEELWSYVLSDQERIWTVQVSDIDSDGTAEIIIGSANGCGYALSNTGEDVKWQVCSEDKEWITSITIMEPAQDRLFEMVIGVKGKEGKVRIFNEQLSLSAEPLKTPQGVRVATAADIDGDGVIEVIAGTDDYGVYAYKRDGKQLWTKKTFDRVRGLSVGDIDNDDRPEIIVGSEDRNVYVFDGAGHQKWLYYTPHRVLDVTTVDVNKDGNVEVLIGNGDGSIYVLSGEGDLLWEHRVDDRVRVVRASDLDQDGNIEIVIASEDTVYFLRVLDQQRISRLIEQCWEGLLQSDPMPV